MPDAIDLAIEVFQTFVLYALITALLIKGFVMTQAAHIRSPLEAEPARTNGLVGAILISSALFALVLLKVLA